jgi:hypothetical protein
MIERQVQAAVDVGLDEMLPLAVFSDLETGLSCSKFSRGTMLVRGANKEDVVADLAAIAGVNVGWQLRACQVAEMLDAVDVRQCGRDECLRHGTLLGMFAVNASGPGTRKSPPAAAGGLGFRRLRAGDQAHATPSGQSPAGRACAFVRQGGGGTY